MTGFFTALSASLQGIIGKPVEFARMPEGSSPPYLILFNITESSDDASMDNPHDSLDVVVQIACVGETPAQVEWLSNRAFDVMVGRTDGRYTHELLGPEYLIDWRLCDYRGATLPSGVSWYQQQDNYRIRREAS